MTLFLHGARSRAGVVKVEVDLGVLGDPELGEQVVDHRRAIGIQDLALDRADPQVFERGIHFGSHLREPLVHHRLHTFEHVLGAEGAHAGA